MEARRLLYTFMVIAPAIALAGIGVHSRTYIDPFRWPSTGADQQRINAYIPLMVEACRYNSHHPSWLDTVDRPALLKVSNRWVDETKAGHLRPLIPVAYDDVVLTGIKGQIVNSMVALNRALVKDADRLAKVGKVEDAAQEALLAVRMANSLKYSSFITVYRCSMLQSTAVNHLEDFFARLSEARRAQIKAELQGLQKGAAPLREIANHAKDIYLYALQTHEDTELALSTTSRIIPSRSFFEQPAAAKERLSSRHDVLYRTLRLPELNTDATLCVQAENYLRLSIQRLLSLK